MAFALSTLLLIALLLRRRRRDGRLPPLLPLVAFLTSVWLWTAFSRLDPLLVYAIPALHSIQYLYFVGLLHRNQARSSAGAPAFASVGRSLFGLAVAAVALGWLILRGLPGWLDGMLVLHDPFDLLGETPYFAAFGAFVNIHHYFMDAVIWRSENPEARHLLA
ncbi:MAG: hypothetical protein QM756_34305 [Polyangiaceae bacterium]